jgi:hypothetical protein
MGDARHKGSPSPEEIEEDVTPAFREQVRKLLEHNEEANRLRGLVKGQAGYAICSQTELAEALTKELGRNVDKNNMRKMLGNVRGDVDLADPELTARSVYVGPIRKLLGMAALVKISVPSDRASVLAAISELPDDLFKRYEQAVMKRD